MTQLGINLPSLIIYLFNFGILLGVLYVLAYKPLLRAIDQRAERISDSLAAADRARDEAASSRAAIAEQLNEARREGQRLLDQAKEASDRFREEEMERARQEATSFVERARADIQRERDAAITEVRVGFGDLAITAAERVIRRSLDRQAHEELISQVLEAGIGVGWPNGFPVNAMPRLSSSWRSTRTRSINGPATWMLSARCCKMRNSVPFSSTPRFPWRVKIAALKRSFPIPAQW